MKFNCNNCGFTAEIPKKIDNCPLCGSNNTACTEVPIDTPAVLADEKDDVAGRSVATVKATNGSREAAPVQPVSDEARARAITLSEEFFNKKPYQEELSVS